MNDLGRVQPHTLPLTRRKKHSEWMHTHPDYVPHTHTGLASATVQLGLFAKYGVHRASDDDDDADKEEAVEK